ncbi:MAG: 2-hydroxyacyl-CoA dehydratase family protein [Coriobacteriaceae bacterium]|nr:2-hydroxyacyl-CoA dehydratase family protein [Coriobacteriaceae bacterium]
MAKSVKVHSKARELMREYVGDIYADVRAAKAAGEPVGYSTSNFAKEIFEVFDLKIVYPENHAAAVAAKKGAVEFCEKAEGMGYSADLCSYARISIGFDERDADFGHGLDIPAPDFLCVGNNICSTVNKWYENLAWKYDIPLLTLDVPYGTQADYEPEKIAYVKSQLQGIVDQLEQIAGKKFDYDKFQDVLETSGENGRLFQEIMDLIGQTKPSPASAFDEYNFMALMIIARGRKETTEVLKLYLEELRERIAADETTFPGKEEHRIFWDGLCCWPYLRQNSQSLAEKGINMVGTPYTGDYGIAFDDLYGMCLNYAGTNNAKGLQLTLRSRSDMIERYQCDGILCNVMRSCKPWVGIMFETQRQLAKRHNLPYTTFDADQADPRVFSEAQFETRLQGLQEVMDARKE